jgi:DNA-binding LacI/PurR family transcriptional regulator
MRFQLESPLPARRGAESLRQQLINYLLRTNPPVGTRFLSDHQLAQVAKLSRPTVRRALHDLHREGWIERRQGHGTFVGPRVAMPGTVRTSTQEPGTRRMVRIAVVIHLAGDLRHDWYSRSIIEGIDEAAEEFGVSLELLGDRVGDPKSISRRLMQTRPDVLALCAPTTARALLIAEARHLDISVIGTGMLLTMFETPTVHEDGEQGARVAVNHLIENGHQRIGWIGTQFVTPWVLNRKSGWASALEAAGIEPDERLCFWVDPDEAGENNVDRLQRYLEKRQPTALAFANFGAMMPLRSLVRRGKISVPRDLSTINLDQSPDVADWIGVQPTHVSIPLKQMGRELGRMGRRIIENEPVSLATALPCTLVEGQSVRKV